MFNYLLTGKYWKKLVAAVIIGFAVVAFWRGVWGLLDIYLLRNNYELSLWAGLGMGLIMLILTHHAIKELT